MTRTGWPSAEVQSFVSPQKWKAFRDLSLQDPYFEALLYPECADTVLFRNQVPKRQTLYSLSVEPPVLDSNAPSV